MIILHLNNPPHVSVTQGHQRLLAILCEVHLLRLCHVLQSGQNLLILQVFKSKKGFLKIHVTFYLQRTKSESRASGLKGGDDLAKVIADHTKPHIVCEFLNDASQGVLSVICHGISLVKNDQFVSTENRYFNGGKTTIVTYLLKTVLVEAKFMICPLTIPMPRSSLAFSSSTMEVNSLAG